MLEIGNAPANLGAGIALAGQGHDDVVVDLREGGAMATEASGAGVVGVLDHAVGAGGKGLQPAE